MEEIPNKNLHKKDDEESEDYYFEKGLLIFTKSYHLKRGYCCKNGCRHCPWGYKKVKPE